MTAKIKITLLTKPQCPLCEYAEEILLSLTDEVAFDLECIDITSDKRLHRKYQYDIPVVLMDGKFVAKHRLNRKEIFQLIKAYQKKQEGVK